MTPHFLAALEPLSLTPDELSLIQPDLHAAYLAAALLYATTALGPEAAPLWFRTPHPHLGKTPLARALESTSGAVEVYLYTKGIGGPLSA